MDETLRKLQLTQLGILQVIDQICKREHISYSLYAGSLLGAVRHQGFIPWDDDLDVCMARSEYDRFLTVWKESPPEGYLLQNKENTPAFSQSFTKIRKAHTTFLQYDWEASKYHTGIFVDIFPMDRMPTGKAARLLFQWHCMKYQLLTREFVPPKGSAAQKLVSRLVLSATPQRKRAAAREKLLRKITRDRDGGHPTVGIEMLSTIGTPLPPDLFDEYVTLTFENGDYMCFKQWDAYLKAKFGDYMTLPPEEERSWKHHPILLDFERDYDEIMKGEKP